MSRALVLGGGGVAGIGWETGVLAGLSDGGVDVLAADRFVGTSAGAAVAAQVTSGTPLPELFDRQVSGHSARTEIEADFDADRMMAELLPLLSATSPGVELRRAVGGYALAAQTVPEPARRRVIESRLPSHDWPAADLRVVAVDAVTGEDVVFTGGSGAGLVDAVAASCAVPGIWPPVTIGGSRYVDGGIRSSSNLDLAAGCDSVLVLAPVGDLAPLPPEIGSAVERLQRDARVLVITPDEASLAAMGSNPLDPATAGPAAAAGRDQAAGHVAAVLGIW